MHGKRIIFYILCLFLSLSLPIEAKRVSIRTFEDLQKYEKEENIKFIVKESVDLRGFTISFAPRCSLIFRGGSFFNGTVYGNYTKLKDTKNNIFRNCNIQGRWETKCAYSSMFDEEMGSALLFNNMSKLSPRLLLFANREYHLDKDEMVVFAEEISAAEKEKPLISFHTTNPNLVGLTIMCDNLVLKNLVICEDYNPINDKVYGVNNITIGNTIVVQPINKIVRTLSLYGCVFYGGTSSSYVASSKVRKCKVENCSFSGYLADHAVYCSRTIESFSVSNCVVKDVSHTSGLFKVRSSEVINTFNLDKISAHNLDGYLANLSLLETPWLKIRFDSITVTKDSSNPSVFYGFCINDETESIAVKSVNAQELTIDKCHFEYGYNRNPILYMGAGKSAYIKQISYLNTITNDSHFGGLISDHLRVSKCVFNNCCSKIGIPLSSRTITISNSSINCPGNQEVDCVFLVNYYRDIVKSICLNNDNVNIDTKDFIRLVKGDALSLDIKNSSISLFKRDLINAPSSCNIDCTIERNEINSIR